jgi:protein-S-isoprenylcysteine O-methyltransferase Ste14
MAESTSKPQHSILIPPVFFLVFLGLGTGLTLAWSWTVALAPEIRWLGHGICALYPGVALWSLWHFRKLKTPIDPRKSPVRLKADGLYRFTRHPIYLAEMLFPVGIFLTTGSVWFLLLQPGLAFALNWFVRRVEEPRLVAAFGSTYSEYCAKTRRWL